MKKQLIVWCFLLAGTGILRAAIRPVKLACEYLQNPMVVDVLKPRLSWINMASPKDRGEVQTAWEIRVASTREQLRSGHADLWSSGKVLSGESVNITYEGKPLTSRQDCWWQVRVWDREGKVSAWSEPSSWSMGLLRSEDWEAQWIGAPWQDDSPAPKLSQPKAEGSEGATQGKAPVPAPLLRKSFLLDKPVASARAYVTGLGFFELWVNGTKVSEDVLSPNITLFGKRDDLGELGVMIHNNFREYRVMYLGYDIKKYLTKGENVIGALLGNGFYNSSGFITQAYGSPRFIGQIYITYTDGTEQLIMSDPGWKAARSPIVMDQVYDGEHYDARLEQPGWCSPGFDDSKWEQVAVRKAPGGFMKAQMSPPDRVMESLSPVKMERLGEGHYKVDFGQQVSGWLHLLNVRGEAGQKIGIKYLCESPNGDNTYIMKGGGPESYAARFTWFVFREVEITNWPGELHPEQLKAEAVSSDIETPGKFECSNPLFNTIQKIWCRAETDNMHGGVASDCPHRERSPYTGDGQVSCVTVMHNFDARSFYTKWIQDILGSQNPETGYVPNGAPWQPLCGGGVAWGAAIDIMPWEFYLHYGDTGILKNNYEGMKGYIRYMLTWTDGDGIMYAQAPSREKPNYWLNLGDWCTPGKLPPDNMVHTFYLWRCADFTARAARVLGKTAEAEEYHNLAEKTRGAFMQKFYDAGKGSYGPYGGNIFALKMGVPADRKDRVIAALKADIAANGGHLDTGIFGTQFFFEVLADNGLNELAYEAMNQRTQPSYGWWIEQGATTTWEQWNGENSRDHPMFGGGLTWFYRKLAGMDTDPENPGYRNIIFKPMPAGDITSASYSNQTPYGFAAIEWKKGNGKFSLAVTVPVGSTATVHIPATDAASVTESGKPVQKAGSIIFQRMEEGYAIYKVESGQYQFVSLVK